jgi:hypothetical protein
VIYMYWYSYVTQNIYHCDMENVFVAVLNSQWATDRMLGICWGHNICLTYVENFFSTSAGHNFSQIYAGHTAAGHIFRKYMLDIFYSNMLGIFLLQHMLDIYLLGMFFVKYMLDIFYSNMLDIFLPQHMLDIQMWGMFLSNICWTYLPQICWAYFYTNICWTYICWACFLQISAGHILLKYAWHILFATYAGHTTDGHIFSLIYCNICWAYIWCSSIFAVHIVHKYAGQWTYCDTCCAFIFAAHIVLKYAGQYMLYILYLNILVIHVCTEAWLV